MQLWIVGQIKSDENCQDWQIQGVFDNEKAAITACRDENYFIGPVKLNKPWPHEPVEWPGAYYPKRKG